MYKLLFFLLPVSAVTGWLFGFKAQNKSKGSRQEALPRDYLTGLNYLINEQPDKAVDVFIRMLEVDSQTVETHLALGSLFRRRGEVTRATRIHQNLIARPQLNHRQRMQALAELAQDYLSAGVLDRAEQLFCQLMNDNEQGIVSLYALIDIYQQQREWDKAIEVAQKIAATGDEQILPAMAHFYCNLAEQAQKNNRMDQARQYLKKAQFADKQSVRPYILMAQLELEKPNPKNAIKALDKAIAQDPDFITEILPLICRAYEQQNNTQELLRVLEYYFSQYPRPTTLILLTDYLSRVQGDRQAMEYLSKMVKEYPSLKGLNQLIDLYIVYSNDEARDKLIILRNLTDQLIAEKPKYRCHQCGFSGQSFYWLCPRCKQWNTVKPIQGIEGD